MDVNKENNGLISILKLTDTYLIFFQQFCTFFFSLCTNLHKNWCLFSITFMNYLLPLHTKVVFKGVYALGINISLVVSYSPPFWIY